VKDAGINARAISTPSHPAAIGPYSQAIRPGNLLFLSGQIPLDPATGNLVEGGVEAQTRQVFTNIGAILEAAGASFDGVVTATVYLADMNDFARSTRSTRPTSLARARPRHRPGRAAAERLLVEIQVIASL
jgi:reactive intermediate/imine deaminase